MIRRPITLMYSADRTTETMMTMSKALGAAQAKAYYQSEYSNSRESYYTEHERVEGEWSGKLAEELGLEGPIEREAFERLMDGQDPRTGEQLVRHVASKEYVNEFGETVKTSEHRAGWDATFSAPKSISIAALVGGDKRLIRAHREAVNETLHEAEKDTQARLGGNTLAETTGKFIAAKFEHDTARPDRETGYAAPQLHTHVVIANLTRTAGGRMKPLQERELYRGQQLSTATYRAKMAEKSQRLGYEIEVDQRTGAPELKGFTSEYLQANSPRRVEVQREAAEMKARLAEQGITVKEGAGLNQAAARVDRKSKHYDRAEMQRRHQEMDARFGHQARTVVEQALERGSIEHSRGAIIRRAQESVTFARDHAMEREAVADMREVTVDALRRNLGLTTYEAVKEELAARQQRGEFIGIVREHQPQRMTTRRMLDMESANIGRVLADQGKVEPITDERRVRELVKEATIEQRIRLNDNQRQAVEMILTSRDRIIGLQGSAGTGKTTTLSVLKQAVERSGYEIKGYAPTTKAVKQLAESGIKTETLQKFIRQSGQKRASDNTFEQAASPSIAHNNSPDGGGRAAVGGGYTSGRSRGDAVQKGYRTHGWPTLYVLDESSLASTRNINTFFDRIGPEDKVLLVGDTRQHQAIEAGSPFEQLQMHGMTTAKLTKIVRQNDASLKRVVEHLSSREIHAAVAGLQARGRVIEIPDERERLRCIAKDYVAQPEGALVISPANKERVAINTMIHQQLQEAGGVRPVDHETSVYVNRQDMTGAERTFAHAYVPGEDIIRYNTRSKVYGVKAGEYGRVTANNYAENTITVSLESGREIIYNPQRLSGVSVYRESERQFAEGDRIQFRAPLAAQRVANSELGVIEHIEGKQFTVALDDGRRVRFDAGEFRHLDHGYAVTSYSSQGETMDRVIINANTTEPDVLLNQRMSYVAVSRAREDAKIYTNSEDELGEALDRQVDKQMALEMMHEAQPTSQRAEHSRHAFVQERSHDIPDQEQRKEVNDRGYGMSL